MELVVLAVQFNHDAQRKRQSALNIRKNVAQEQAHPEWQLNTNTSAKDSVAAYAIAPTAGRTITIKVLLDPGDSPVETIQLRAIQPPASQWPWWSYQLPNPLLLWALGYFRTIGEMQAYTEQHRIWLSAITTAGNILGNIKPHTLNIQRQSEPQWHTLELQNTRIDSRGIGRHPVSWQWQYRHNIGDAWINLQTTSHIVYTLLDIPALPWLQETNEASSTQLPWADVLDYACQWAAGAKTKAEAALRVTQSVFALGTVGLLEYGCPIWAMEMYAKSSYPWNHFDCSAFLDRLNGGIGNGRYVNCSDCATIVSTFANILGCDLWQSRMGQYFPHFEMSKILAIGTPKWDIPCGVWPGFSFHEVAWTDDCVEKDRVFDACLHIDLDWMPWADPQIPWLPANMRFGYPGERQYRDKLATPAGSLKCVPRPWEQRRRAVF